MERIPVPGEIYRHFKGNLYRVVTLAQHTENGEQLVVYQGLYGDYPVYARPLSSFTGEVDRRKYPQAQDRYRFTLIPEVGVPGKGAAPLSGGGDCGQNPCAGDEGHKAGPKPGSKLDSEGEEALLDPDLLDFLEADSYEKKLEVFGRLAGKADGHMLNTIAVSLDLELSGDSIEEQYETLKNCLLTLERYEYNRLR